jgi:hypothetical protein
MKMNTYLAIPILTGGLLLGGGQAEAHCDGIDGPVATTAVRALETGNVYPVLAYVPAAAEPELTEVFAQARAVRGAGPEAKALADRHFMETAVRLHRAGEGAAYTGLRPAGIDFGPAIPAAEAAIRTGNADPALALLAGEAAHGLEKRLEHVQHASEHADEPTTEAGVAAAREKVRAELAFIGYVQGLYVAATNGGHAE